MSPSTHTSSSPSPPASLEDKIASLERQLQERNQQLAAATSAKKKRVVTTQTLGRGIRRLVSCFGGILTMTGEADRRMLPEGFNDPEIENLTLEEEEDLKRTRDRLFTGFTLLLNLVPQITTVLQSPDLTALTTYATKLQDGANSARSDDISRIKTDLVFWLRKRCGADPLSPENRDNRGLQHDVCGRLLCPIDFDWDDEDVRAAIRNGTSTFNINDSFFLRCLYKNEAGDPNDLQAGFLRHSLLLKTFRAIFLSKDDLENHFSTEAESSTQQPSRRRTKQRGPTRPNVASILKMNGKVTGRSIAYTAVILVFNLTDAVQWTECHNGFDFRAFYEFLVDYFEEPQDTSSRRHVNALLQYWNKSVFPDRVSGGDTRASGRRMALQRSGGDASAA